jgi:hypothetical protein
MYIRSLFEANKNVKEPRQQRVRVMDGIRRKYTAGADCGTTDTPRAD